MLISVCFSWTLDFLLFLLFSLHDCYNFVKHTNKLQYTVRETQHILQNINKIFNMYSAHTGLVLLSVPECLQSTVWIFQ